MSAILSRPQSVKKQTHDQLDGLMYDCGISNESTISNGDTTVLHWATELSKDINTHAKI